MASIPTESGGVLDRLLDRMLEALASHDARRFTALFADDYVTPSSSPRRSATTSRGESGRGRGITLTAHRSR